MVNERDKNFKKVAFIGSIVSILLVAAVGFAGVQSLYSYWHCSSH